MKVVWWKIVAFIGRIILKVGIWLDYKVSYDMEALGAKLMDGSIKESED